MADIVFTGNLGADSKMSFTPSGSPVLNFRVCDTKSKKDGNGGWQKVSEQWFGVELWGSIAEFLADQLLSGVRVKVYGQFYTREYDGKNGRGYSLDVKASTVEVLTSSKDRQKLAGQGNTQQPQTEDPWATPPAQNTGGWGTPPESEPPF